ncbi:hypothetical protein [Mesorhizobium amorphae]|uniref:hypothetical protein n=1 Tax=Mesorhizobium amorphae TaxID=71433 RepID=UPI00177D3BF0|nr:hypothetical protein [Mesorhizobium amorphae]
MSNGAGEARLRFIKPLEPVLVLEPPVSDDWLHEIKFDGFRVHLAAQKFLVRWPATLPEPRLFASGEGFGIFRRKEALDAYQAVLDDAHIMLISKFLDLHRGLWLRVHRIAPLMEAETSSPGECSNVGPVKLGPQSN